MEPIVNSAKKISSYCSEIATSTFNQAMSLITLVCNSPTFRYERDERPIVRITRYDIKQSFLFDTKAQRKCMPVKISKQICGTDNCKRLPEKDLHIKLYNNLGCKGTYLVLMQIFGMMHDLVVMVNVQDKILEINFIRRALTYKALTNNCFQETPPVNSVNLLAQERIFIDGLRKSN
jgi:hypothetical protein